MPSVRFTLPFIRADVFTELCRFGRPLGVYGRDVQFQAQKGSNIAADDLVYVGCQRAAYFSQESQLGYTVSECVEVVPHARLVWRELQCRKKGLQYVKVSVCTNLTIMHEYGASLPTISLTLPGNGDVS